MSEFILLLLSTALVNNVVLIKFLGLCPVMGVSKSVDSAFGMGLATTFVITLAAGASWMLDNWLLQPLGLGYLRILTFILVIAAVVQFTEMFIKKTSPGLYQSLGIYLPLITTNCAVLGVALLNVEQKFSLFKSLLYGFGSALGFTIVLLIFAGLRERIALARVPGRLRRRADFVRHHQPAGPRIHGLLGPERVRGKQHDRRHPQSDPARCRTRASSSGSPTSSSPSRATRWSKN